MPKGDNLRGKKTGNNFAFNKNLKNRLSLMGIDFLLEAQNGKLIPIFLEVNPRPAGLNNIRRIL